MSGQAVYGVKCGAQNYLRANYERVKHIPEPGQEYRRAELHEDLEPLVDKLVSYGVMYAVDRRGPANRTPVVIYQTDERAYRVIDDYHKGGIIMPCGHRGMKNRGDYFTCGFEECDEHFTRAEAEEAIEG